MKKNILYILVLMFGFTVNGQDNQKVTPALEVLSSFPNVRDFTMSSTREEAYVTIQSPLGELSVLAQINKVGNVWSKPKIVPFSGKFNDLEPFLSKNNLKLYFASNRPLSESVDKSKDFDIWYVERKTITSEWGIPVNMGAPINTKHNEFYPSVSENNNMYFTSDNPSSIGKDDIFYSAWNKGKYIAPVPLGEAINSEGYEFNAYISPDESYIIYSAYNRKDGLGSGDLYISFLDENKKWSIAVNLGKEINSKYMDYCPFIDLGTETLYFTSKRSTINKKNNFQSIEEVVKEINKSKNGLSRIYKVPIEKELLQTQNY